MTQLQTTIERIQEIDNKVEQYKSSIDEFEVDSLKGMLDNNDDESSKVQLEEDNNEEMDDEDDFFDEEEDFEDEDMEGDED